MPTRTPMPLACHVALDFHSGSALQQCLQHWQAEAPDDTVLALLPEDEQARLPALQQHCTALGLRLVGGVFPALIHERAFVHSGAWLLRLPRGAQARLIGDLAADAGSAAAQLAQVIQAARPQPGATLFMIFDAMLPHIASVLDELYLALADMVRYLGVNAGSESFQPMPCVFDNQQRLGNAVLCVLLPPGLQSALAHGYLSPADPVSVTASTGNRIASIDWQPAFEVYRQRVAQQYGVELNRDNFYQHAVHFPFGIALANGETLVRIPVALDPDGTIHCVGEVPEYAMLTLLQGPPPDAPQTIQTIAQELARTPESGALLGFYCAGRRMHLGPAAECELAALSALAGDAPLAGALSLGEVGEQRNSSYPHFHNGALICANWRWP